MAQGLPRTIWTALILEYSELCFVSQEDERLHFVYYITFPGAYTGAPFSLPTKIHQTV